MGKTESLRQSRLVQAVRCSPVLGRLAADELARVLGSARSVRAARAEPLRRADDDAVTIVLDGVAVASVPAVDGGDIVTGILGPGSTVGLPVVLGQPDGDSDVITLAPAEALVIPGADYRQRLAELPGLASATMRTLAAEVSVARRETARFTATSTTERVLGRLVELAEQWGEHTEFGIRIRIPLTQDMLASWARSSRESTAKVLHELRSAGVIRTARRELTVLDLDRLRARGGNGGRADDAVRTLLRSIG